VLHATLTTYFLWSVNDFQKLATKRKLVKLNLGLKYFCSQLRVTTGSKVESLDYDITLCNSQKSIKLQAVEYSKYAVLL